MPAWTLIHESENESENENESESEGESYSPVDESTDCGVCGPAMHEYACSECTRWQCGMPTANGKCTNPTHGEGEDFCQNHQDTDFRLTDYDAHCAESIRHDYFRSSSRRCCDRYIPQYNSHLG
jgi:hypothetical protein